MTGIAPDGFILDRDGLAVFIELMNREAFVIRMNGDRQHAVQPIFNSRTYVPALIRRVDQHPQSGEVDWSFGAETLHQSDVVVLQLAFLRLCLIEDNPARESTSFALEIKYLVRRIELHLLRTDPTRSQHFRVRETDLIPDDCARFRFVGVFAFVALLLFFRLNRCSRLTYYLDHSSTAQIGDHVAAGFDP